jgi:hypothetical protein
MLSSSSYGSYHGPGLGGVGGNRQESNNSTAPSATWVDILRAGVLLTAKAAGIFVQANCSGGLEYWRPRERHKADRNRGGDNGGMKTRDSPAMCARQGQSHPGVEADEAHLLLVANSFIRCLEGVRRSSASDRAGAVRLSHQRLPANAQSASKRHLVCFPKASKLGPETRQLVVNTDEYSSLLCSSLVCQGAWNENRRIHHP